MTKSLILHLFSFDKSVFVNTWCFRKLKISSAKSETKKRIDTTIYLLTKRVEGLY